MKFNSWIIISIIFYLDLPSYRASMISQAPASIHVGLPGSRSCLGLLYGECVEVIRGFLVLERLIVI